MNVSLTNNSRVLARDWLIPYCVGVWPTTPRTDGCGVRATRPAVLFTDPRYLFDDPHLNATGGLAPWNCRRPRHQVPLLPLKLGGVVWACASIPETGRTHRCAAAFLGYSRRRGGC